MRQQLQASELFLRSQSDERLAVLCRDGNTRAFAILAERHRRVLLGHACRLVGATQGEDVLQQSLLKAWRALQDGADVQHPQAWLRRIVHNTALSELDRQPQQTDQLDDQLSGSRQSAEAAAEQNQELLEVLRGLAELPARERVALLGTELEGRSRRQLATELGLSEGAVRQLVYRARRRVRAGIAVLVPFPLLARVTRAWARGSMRKLASSSTAASGPGLVAGTVIKVGVVTVAAAAVGGGVFLGSASGHHAALGPPVKPPVLHAPVTREAAVAPAAYTLSLQALGSHKLRRSFPAGSSSPTHQRPAAKRVTPATPAPPPATPSPQPATPAPQPATPSPQPATPSPQPATPAPQPAVPAPQPAASSGGTANSANQISIAQPPRTSQTGSAGEATDGADTTTGPAAGSDNGGQSDGPARPGKRSGAGQSDN